MFLRMRSLLAPAVLAFFTLGVQQAPAQVSAAAQAVPAAAPDASNAKNEAYCTSHGGTVETRQPEYNTNNPNRLQLSGTHGFCSWTKSDGSSIHVFLDTLATPEPTLAALAYYGQVKFQGKHCNGSPGSCYCSQLGGTDLFGGINAAGGGWVATNDQNDVLDACIFPDLSSIDSYGLFYHSAGVIRGKDLSKVLAYKDPNAN